MSTVCKLDPMIRQRRAMRRNLLRNPPPMTDKALRAAVLAELSMIQRDSHLTGETKHILFARGAKQMAE